VVVSLVEGISKKISRGGANVFGFFSQTGKAQRPRGCNLDAQAGKKSLFNMRGLSVRPRALIQRQALWTLGNLFDRGSKRYNFNRPQLEGGG